MDGLFLNESMSIFMSQRANPEFLANTNRVIINAAVRFTKE